MAAVSSEPDSGAAKAPAPDPASITVEERLAVLEERTKPAKKTLIDVIKEWGGVATAVIALLYSFPLGVWDRFVVPDRVRIARKSRT